MSYKYGNRQVRRIQKAIDELIKICDDGKCLMTKGGGMVMHTLNHLRELESYYEEKSNK